MEKDTFLNYLENKFFPNSHRKHWFLIGLVSLIALVTATYNASHLQVSVMGALEQEVVFDGTMFPYDRTYDWYSMEYSDWKADLKTVESKYNTSNIEVEFFPYSEDSYLKAIQKSDASSSNYWNTYLVPWSYGYNGDSGHPEGPGSHPGFDIRGVRNMPIYSIANSEVIKVKDSDGTVCTKINDVKINGVKQTIYPCYLHMNYRTVAEGDIIMRGQQIGGTGDKGFATTPHVHLQIDTQDAPWHPYWPFSYAEADEAGLSFTEAVDAGLGLENLKKYTIDPMAFIQDNLVTGKYTLSTNLNEENPTNNMSEQDSNTEIEIEETEIPDEEQVDQDDSNLDSDDEIELEIVEDYVSPEINENDPKAFKIESRNYYPNKSQTVKVCLLDEYSEVTTRKPVNEIFIEITQGQAELSKEKIVKNSFIEGCAELELTTQQEKGIIEIYVHDVLHRIKGSLEIKDFEFSDVDSNSEFYDAILYAFLNDITTGYPDGSFQPNREVSRIESVAFILRALEWEAINNPEFDLPDASSKEWYAGLLAKAMIEGMVTGYPDGTVKLTNTVNGAEFLKMFITAFAEIRDPENNEEWYQRFLEYAESKNLINESFNASSPLDRAKVVEIIYLAKDLI